MKKLSIFVVVGFCLVIGNSICSIAQEEPLSVSGNLVQQDGIDISNSIKQIVSEAADNLSDAQEKDVRAIVAEQFTEYKSHITDLKDIFICFVGFVGFIFALITGMQAFQIYQGSEERKQMIERLKREIGEKAQDYLSSVRKALTATMDLNEASLGLRLGWTTVSRQFFHSEEAMKSVLDSFHG